MSRALDIAMGWIVAIWLFFAVCNDGYVPYICMGGAMGSVALWAVIRIAFVRFAQPDHHGGG